MSDAIMSSIITAIAAVVCCLLGTKFGRDNILRGLDKTVIEQQLKNVYSPIQKMNMFHPDLPTADKLQFVNDIFYAYFELIPPQMLDEFHHLLHQSQSSDINLSLLFEMIESNYHWSKKLLKYPYAEIKIEKEHLPTYETRSTIVETLIAISYSVGFISLLTSVSFYLDHNATGSAPPLITICGSVFAAYLFFVVIQYIDNYIQTKR